MFIAFEGIDGSGKTTLSNRLAQRLSRLGYRVTHAREGGQLSSPTARRVRELTRDARLFQMSPQAELFLNLARDAQQLDEVIRPALLRKEIVIADRYLDSQRALAKARGLDVDSLAPAFEAAAQGVWPDLVIFVDVDPELARLRKKLGKILDGRADAPDSRKGLNGAGLVTRVREAFQAMADSDPQRWKIVENDEQPLWLLENAIAELVLARLEGRAAKLPPMLRPNRDTPALSGVESAFFAMLDEVAPREPALAAHLLAGVPGLASHKRRLAFAERFPSVIARGLFGLADAEADALREILAARAPGDVAFSLTGVRSERAMELRLLLFDKAPEAVLASLQGCDEPRAWAMRHTALRHGALERVLAGLGGVDTERAWEVRERGLRQQLWREVALSLLGVGGGRADAMREAIYAADKLAAVDSTLGLDSPFARRAREECFGRALKVVMRSLVGVTAPYATELRERAAPLSKEALDSLDGLCDESSWSLRERYAAKWPSTAISSIREHGEHPRARTLIAGLLEREGPRIPILRSAYAVIARSHPRSANAAAQTDSVTEIAQGAAP